MFDDPFILDVGVLDTRFGDCLVAATGKGICHLSFTMGDSAKALARLRTAWPGFIFREQVEATEAVIRKIFDTGSTTENVPVDVRGTPFQRMVWEALRRIPLGQVTTYSALAASIGHPKASRAVGTAVGDNPIAVFVPCHRVIRKDGSLGGYAYGTDIKSALLRWEGALR